MIMPQDHGPVESENARRQGDGLFDLPPTGRTRYFGQAGELVMDVTQAIDAAKAFATIMFKGEQMTDLGVEEVEKSAGCWRITLGLSRPFGGPSASILASMGINKTQPLTYHVFQIDDQTGEVSSVRLRQSA